MNLSQEDLERAVTQKIILEEQAQALWKLANSSVSAPPSQLNSATVLPYLGALVVLVSMSWLATIWQDKLGPFSLFWIGLFYGIIFLWSGWTLWKHPSYRTGGGLLLTLAVCMVPLMLYGLEKGWGFWPQPLGENWTEDAVIQHHQILSFYQASLEITTILAAACMLWFVRFPFLTVPLWLAFWLLSVDLVPLFFPPQSFAEHEFKELSLVVGIVILIIAFILDGRTKEDFAFWAYLIGLSAAWIALTSFMPGASQWIKGAYCLMNIALLFVAVVLDRKVFLVFGALGILGYLCYLAYSVFADSWLFPWILSLLGIGTLYLGVLYQRHQNAIRQSVQQFFRK